MTETLIGVQKVLDENGKIYQFSYYRMDSGKDYGVCIRDQEGSMAMAPGVTTQRRRINALLRRLMRGGVSPTALGDVLEDWLAE